jgi:NodT family efflux transporter outer membrane factor (OMF) lipoprotein
LAEGTSVAPRARVLRSSVSIGWVIAISACSVGPKFVKPEVAVNPAWSEASDPRLSAKAAADITWWSTFQDPTLDRLIELAYHQNLSLQIAGLRILEARAQLGIAVGEQLPSNVNPIVTGQAVGLSKHAANSSILDHNYGEYQVGFDAVWEVDFWGKYRKGARAANATYYATIADYDGALVSLSAEVARTYVTIRTYEVLIDLAKKNEQVQQEGLDIAQSRFKNGATSELDVAQATTLLETTRAQIPELQIGLVQARNALSTLLAQPTGYVDAILTQPGGIPTPPPQIAVSVPAEVLRRRPDIRGAELRAMAQCDRIGIAKADLFPKFVLFGSIGTSISTNAGPLSNNSTLENLFGPGSLAYNAGASLFWPILNYPKLVNGVRVEDARYQETLVDYVNTVLVAEREVEDGITGYLREQDAAVSAQNAAASAENAVKLALIQYREGAVDYTRVLDTQRDLLSAENRLASTRSAVATNLIALYKALGGGWEVREGAQVVPEPTQREMQNRTNWGGYLTQPSPKR